MLYDNQMYKNGRILHHTCSRHSNVALQKKVYKFFLNISTCSMQIVQKVNQKCAQNLPYYTDVSNYTSQKYQESLACFNNMYDCSAKSVRHYQRVAKQFQIDLFWMLSQATDDFLEFIEDRLQVQPAVKQQFGRSQRVQRIFNKLKDQHVQPHIHKFMQMNETLVAKGKNAHRTIIVPLYLRVRATVEVSKQLLLEAFSTRMGELKMSYKYSKDHITMYWNGEFKEEKIVEKIKAKFGELRQFTVSFAQKGMEIKVNKEDLVNNYHKIMSKLSELMQEVGEKGAEQWSETKNKTVDLYQTVLRRIREKERNLQIRFEGRQIEAPKRAEPERLEERVQEPITLEKAQVATSESEPAQESPSPKVAQETTETNPAEPEQKNSEHEEESEENDEAQAEASQE